MQHNGVGTETPDARPLSEIAKAIIADFQQFFRAEIRLAGTEIKEKTREGAKAGALLGTAALLGFFAAACLITTCVVALAIVLPLWLASLVIGVMLAFAAGGAFMLGRLALQQIDFIPQRTVQILRETLERVSARAR
jgi:hypothetical protein